MNIILFNLVSFINGLCNIGFILILIARFHVYLNYPGFSFKPVVWIIFIICILGIIFIPPEEVLKQWFNII